MLAKGKGWGTVKKISSWVRPGVCEMRASARREVSALIRLDLPTLERPANAISTPRITGSAAAVPAAAAKRHSAANSLRPASISPDVKLCVVIPAERSGAEREPESTKHRKRVGLIAVILRGLCLLGPRFRGDDTESFTVVPAERSGAEREPGPMTTAQAICRNREGCGHGSPLSRGRRREGRRIIPRRVSCARTPP